ncbi:MAG TPA: hypothetical protein VEY11_07825 [Pyrinomonadaceae bacterium]|nr:hypothetical protein [Pyrinomonadaceae bacterium]
MRWKLLIITSLVVALINTGGMRALAYWTIDHTACLPTPGPATIFVVLAVPIFFITLACIFVYRHTARRRKLQVALTALFALILTGTLLVITAKLLPRSPAEARALPAGAARVLA